MRAYGHKYGQWVAGKLFCSTKGPATLAWPVGAGCKHSQYAFNGKLPCTHAQTYSETKPCVVQNLVAHLTAQAQHFKVLATVSRSRGQPA